MIGKVCIWIQTSDFRIGAFRCYVYFQRCFSSCSIWGDSFIVVFQLLNHVQHFLTPSTATRQVSLFSMISWSLLKLMSIELVMPPNHLILFHPFLLLPSIFSSSRVFSNESVLHIRWPKYSNFSIDPSNEHSGFIPLGLTGLTSLLSKGLSGVFSSTTIWKHQFFNAQPCLWFNSHIHTWLLEKP